MTKISVTILTWNCFKTLISTIGILKVELSNIKSEIIVVDNGSDDHTQDFMRLEINNSHDNIKVIYIRNETNLGISKGKNQGIDVSTGDYIMLIDGDVVPVPNSIICLAKHLDTVPDCHAIGFLPNKFSVDRNKYGKEFHESYCDKLEPIEEHKGHCIYYGMYRKEVFEKIRFDETFGAGYGYEDLDSYMQMQLHGIKQWYGGINHKCGKYHHAINSSIRKGGFEWYMETQNKRKKIFDSKWQGVQVVG